MSVQGRKFIRSFRHSFSRVITLSALFGAVAAFCIAHSWQLVRPFGG